MGYCRVCKEKWSGLSVAHCTGCHRTFKSVNAFDRHRDKEKFTCIDPMSLGMEMSEKGIWRVPMSEKEKERFKILA